MIRSHARRVLRRRAAGPWHDFWLIRPEQIAQRHSFVRRQDAPVRLSDDVLGYFHESLIWLPTINPELDGARGLGLNWYGTSVIRSEDGQRMFSLFDAWARIFACERPRFVLRTSPEVMRRQGRLQRSFPSIVIERDALVASLRTLARFGRRIARDGNVVLHLGI